tara:strand:+ start:63 stop:299 length:237 start_codon:yes stop_codon:yes gene_type:complete
MSQYFNLGKLAVGKAYKAFKKLEKKADKFSEKAIKQMNSPKPIEKAKGYTKLVVGALGMGTVFPSTVDKDKKNGGKKE